MAVSSNGPVGSSSTWTQAAEGKRRHNAETEAAAKEKEARQRIQRAEAETQAARKEADERVDYVRDEGEKRLENERVRRETAYEEERMKGYEVMRNLKLAQEQEMRRVKDEGQRRLNQTEEYYRDTIYNTKSGGDKQIREFVAKQNTEAELALNEAQFKITNQKADGQQQLEGIRQENQIKTEKLHNESRQNYETNKELHRQIGEKTRESFEEGYQNKIAEQNARLNELNARTTQKINEYKQDHAAKLAAYGSQQKDPFYQMVNLNARLLESANAYQVAVAVPDYEQEGVKVTVRGNEVVVSGSRRNEESLKDPSGGGRKTSSFQTFHQSFPIVHPVDKNSISREYVDGQLVVTMPKEGYGKLMQPKKEVERLRAERPQFPENIVLAEERVKNRHKIPGESDGSSSGTLS